MWPFAVAAAVFVLLEASALAFFVVSARRQDRDSVYMSLMAIEFCPILFLLSPGSPLASLLPRAVSDAIVVVGGVLMVITAALFILRHPGIRSRW